MDPDIPTNWEGRFFNSTPAKFLWILLLPATYSLRPMITRPKEVCGSGDQSVKNEYPFSVDRCYGSVELVADSDCRHLNRVLLGIQSVRISCPRNYIQYGH